MKYLPVEHLIYKTNLSEQEIKKRLKDSIERKKIRFIFSKPMKEYEGFIIENRFEINRIVKGRNSFLPQITGTIQRNNDETQIEVKMKLHWSIIIFIMLWCSFILFFLISAYIETKKISVDIFILACVLLFMYLFVLHSFKSESKKSKEHLKKIFKTEIVMNK